MSRQATGLCTYSEVDGDHSVELVTKLNPLPVEIILNPTVFNEYLHQHTGTVTTLAIATSPLGGDISITVVDATSFAVNDYIHISNGTGESTFARILAKPGGNVLDLDRRVDFKHEIGVNVEVIIFDLNVSGTIPSPQEYFVSPEGGGVCHVQRMMISLVHGTAGDMALFGNLTALTNGVLLRVKQNGVYRTLTNWKTNADVNDDMFDVTFDTRASGGGSYGTTGRWTFERFGVELRLDGATGDRIEMYIQDDLTNLDHFTAKIQGHYV